MSCPSCYMTNKISCDICGFKSIKSVDTNIYVLELAKNKYYIGKTTTPTFRLEQHFNSNGSAWTKKYKPIRVLEIIPNCDDYDEDKYTLKYMKQYGIDNVRGGSFCQIELDEENINTINRMINGSTDKCYKCGGNHFVNNCSNNSNKITCFRCQREGHTIDNCYASTDKNGEEIIDYESEEEVFACSYCNKEFDSYKGAQFHENVHCKNKSTKKTKENKCFRCGRSGHYATDCYAKTNINKEEISESNEEETTESNEEKISESSEEEETTESNEEIEVYCCDYCGKEFDTEKGARFHENVHCKNKPTKQTKQTKCFRCGRSGHYATDCYANSHINGNMIFG